MTQAAPICIVTRPEPDGSRFAERLETEFGLQTVLSPLLRIEREEVSIQPDSYDALILTSANAARLLPDISAPVSVPCFTVGHKTAAAARELGYNAISAGGDAADLVAMIQDMASPGRLLHLRGEHTVGAVVPSLLNLGYEAEEHIVYKQISLPLSPAAQLALQEEPAPILPLFSPRSARLFLEQRSSIWAFRPVTISQAVADVLPPALREHTRIALEPTEKAVMQAIGDLPLVRAWVENGKLQS